MCGVVIGERVGAYRSEGEGCVQFGLFCYSVVCSSYLVVFWFTVFLYVDTMV